MQLQPKVYTSITLVGLKKIGWHHIVGRLDRITGSTHACVIDFGAELFDGVGIIDKYVLARRGTGWLIQDNV